jgi:hypothetical protein
MITGCSSQADNQERKAICESIPQTYKVQVGDGSDSLGFVGSFNLDFQQDRQLLVSGWNKTEIQRIKLNPLAGQPQIQNTNLGETSITACDGKCSATVIDMSPDKRWILALSAKDVLWLSNREQTYIEQIATRPLTWRWSSNSNWLWVEEASEGFGRHAIKISLQVPTTKFRDLLFSGKLPNRNLADFSSIDGSVLSVNDSTSTLNLIQITGNLTSAISSQSTFTGLFQIYWNESTDQFLLASLTDEALEIMSHDQSTHIKIPTRSLQPLYERVRPGFRLQEVIADSEIAISVDVSLVAIGWGRLYVFQCQKVTT